MGSGQRPHSGTRARSARAPRRIPIGWADRGQDDNDAGIVAVKSQTLGFRRLGREHDDICLVHLIRSTNAPRNYERLEPLVATIGKWVR